MPLDSLAERDDKTTAARQSYLAAKRAIAEQQERIGHLRQQQQHLWVEAEQVQRAMDLQKLWNLLQTATAHLAPSVTAQVTTEELARLRELQQQIRQARERLERLQGQRCEQLERLQASEDLAQRNRQLTAILDAWPICRDRQRRLVELRRELADRPSTAEGSRSRDSQTRQAIREVRQAAQTRRGARHELRLSEQHASVVANTASIGGLNKRPVASVTDPQLESLHRQVRQLREETRRMLQRQLLSRRVLISIGLLFSIGVAILLSALVLNLDGAELATGGIGLTCIVAAALLKSSFERTPSYQLRRQRLRIAALLAEIERVRGVSAAETPAAEEAVATTSGALSVSEAALAEQAARDEWVAARCELPSDTPPLGTGRRVDTLGGRSSVASTRRACARE